MTKRYSARVAIITVTYNAADFIANYLEPLLELLKQAPNTQLFLVDNASTDGTLECIDAIISSHPCKARVNVLPLTKNLGFGCGCNTGAEAANIISPEYLWFLNPDTIVEDDAFQALLVAYQRHSKADFIGSTLQNENRELRSGAFRFPRAITVLVASAKLKLLDYLFASWLPTFELNSQDIRADWLTGASFMVRSQAFHALGGFDPSYFLYFEEVDLFLRAKRAGFEVWSTQESVVYHISGASTGMNQRRVSRNISRSPKYWFESRRYFYQKNFGLAYFILVDCSLLIGLMIQRCKCILKKKPYRVPEHFLRDILAHNLLFFWRV